MSGPNADPFQIWRGLCGHVWDRRDEDTELCPRCYPSLTGPQGSTRLDLRSTQPPNDFIPCFMDESYKARAIVLDRAAGGRNATMSVKDQFPSTLFVLDMIRMKLARAQSYLAAGNFDKFQEEMHDCSNYSLFAVVFEAS